MNYIGCGTDTYQSPEFDKRGGKYCSKVDVWAIGMIIYQLVTGKHFFGKVESYRLPDKKRKSREKLDKIPFAEEKGFTEK